MVDHSQRVVADEILNSVASIVWRARFKSLGEVVEGFEGQRKEA